MIQRKHSLQREQQGRYTILVLISAALITGGILGYFLFCHSSGEIYLQNFLENVKANAAPQIWRTVWAVFRWPLGVVFLSLLPFAGITVPFLCFIRGMMLTYSAASAFAISGTSGIALAFLLFGVNSILTVPVQFAISTELLQWKANRCIPREWLPIGTLCLCVLLLCILAQQKALPYILPLLK